MPKELFRYTPALEDAQDLKAVSVGREGEVKRLLRDIEEGAKKRGNQHFLIVGPRGIGKTHLLLLIYHSIKGTISWNGPSQHLSEFWVPILFAEEEYRIASLTDLLLEILSRLKDETPDKELLHLAAKLDQVPLPGEAEKEQVLDYLLKRREETGKKFLLLLDNIQDILPYFTEEDQGRLRDILMSKDLFMLVATSPTLFDTVVNYEAPFYNFFEIVWLQEIEAAQVKELIAKRLRIDGRDDLLGKLKDYEGRLKAIIHLTGGNPRLILSLYQIFAESKILEVERDFLKLLDEMTPYFQDRMKSLSAQKRKVIESIALLEGPSTPTEIARVARLPVNVTNSQLNRLKEAGFVRPIKEKGKRETLYDVRERLFRMWRQMRVEAGRRRLQFIVKFIEIWFSPRELAEQLVKMAKELKVSLAAGAFESAKEITDELYYIQEAAPSPLRLRAHFERVYGLVELGDLNSAEREAENLLSEPQAKRDGIHLAMALWENALVCYAKGDRDKEVEHLQLYLELRPDDVNAWNIMGNAYADKGEYDEAIPCYQKAVEIKPDMHGAWNNLGSAYFDKGEYDEAIRCYQKAVKIKPDMHGAWYNMGNAYLEKGELKEAINSFSQAIEFAEERTDIALYLIERAVAFGSKGNDSAALKDAEKAYRLASRIAAKPLISLAATLSIAASLNLSSKNATKKRGEKALEDLQRTLRYLPEATPERIQGLFGNYFKELLKLGNRGFIKRALEVIEESGQSDLIELLKPYRVAIQYLEKKDRSILNRLVPEIREIVEEIVAKLAEGE